MKKKTIFKITVSALAVISAIILAFWLVMEFYVMPKVNKNVPAGVEITTGEAIDIAKYLVDPDVLEIVKNFDKETVSGMVTVIEEIETEIEAEIEESAAPSPKKTPKPTKKPQKDDKSSYDKIMETASKEEIAKGMAVIKKINMAEANKQYREGGIKALKKYVIKTLSKSDLNTAVKLYNKYKHLL